MNTEVRKFPKAYWKIIWPKVVEFAFKLTLLGLTMDDLDRCKLFPRVPNSTPQFRCFLRLVKDGQSAAARGLLFDNRLLVYHFDHVRPSD